MFRIITEFNSDYFLQLYKYLKVLKMENWLLFCVTGIKFYVMF